MLDVIKAIIAHPSFLLLVFQPWNRLDKRIDELIEYILTNADRIGKIERTGYRVTIAIGEYAYSFWRANRFYAYLTNCDRYVKDEDGDWRYSCSLWEGRRPSLLNAVKFWLAFDVRDPMCDDYMETFIGGDAP